MNDVSTRERVGREAPLQKVVDWDVFFSPLAKRVVWDAKEGLKHVDILGHELLQDVSVDVLTAIAEADKRGWRVVRAKDRVGFYNDHHLAQKAPAEVFTSRNSFIKCSMKELRNLCGLLGLKKEGSKFDHMTRLAEYLELPLDEVALPAEKPPVVLAPVAPPVPAINPPEPSMELVSTLLTCPYGRARPLIRQDRWSDGRLTGWSEPIKGRTLENMVNVLIKTGTFTITHGPAKYVDQEGKAWKCVILKHSPRNI